MPKLLKQEAYVFYASEAIEYGLHEALLIAHIRQWILTNTKKDKNKVKDKYWTYNSYANYSKAIPFLTYYQIRYTLRKLVDMKVLEKRVFKKNYVEMNGYTFVDLKMLTIPGKRVPIKKEAIVLSIKSGF